MFWDGEDTPSVEVPFGDFFGVTNGKIRYFSSLLLTVTPGGFGKSACDGFNTYFPMPFVNGARVEVTNEQDEPVPAFWYHLDYEEYDGLDADVGRFHAQWRRTNPTRAEPQDGGTRWQGSNLTGENNYVILDAAGKGNYVGFVLGVDNITGDWWGEGDDMVFIDGEIWPPSLHGTGTEEIFGGGACPNQEYAGPYTGFHLITDRLWAGKNGMYRLFINDPIRFQKTLKVTLEHGHNNDLANDYSSVAFWYQSEPHAPFPKLPAAAERLPRMAPEFYQLQPLDREITQRLWRSGNRLPLATRHEILVDVWWRLNEALNEEQYGTAKELMEELDTVLKKHLGDG